MPGGNRLGMVKLGMHWFTTQGPTTLHGGAWMVEVTERVSLQMAGGQGWALKAGGEGEDFGRSVSDRQKEEPSWWGRRS